MRREKEKVFSFKLTTFGGGIESDNFIPHLQSEEGSFPSSESADGGRGGEGQGKGSPFRVDILDFLTLFCL